MEDKNQRSPKDHIQRHASRRKCTSDRRRANFGADKKAVNRRKNPGDRRVFLGDRRKATFSPGVEPLHYHLDVGSNDDWEKKISELKRKKPI